MNRYVHIRSVTGSEQYMFFAVYQDDNFWYSRNDARFPKSNFREVKAETALEAGRRR